MSEQRRWTHFDICRGCDMCDGYYAALMRAPPQVTVSTNPLIPAPTGRALPKRETVV